MKKKISYTSEPMGAPKVVRDFLPPPKDLILKEDAVRITMLVSKRSFDFFKRQAARYRIPYQKMIRRILDLYAERHED
jgi:predicted DNA binding CopG/RHH family protein